MKCIGMIALLALFIAGETQARRYECNRSTPYEGKGRVTCTKGTKGLDMCIPCGIFRNATPEELHNLCISEFPDQCPPRCPEDLLEKCTKACPVAKDKTQCEKKCNEDFKKCREPKCKAEREYTLDVGCPI